VTPNAGISGIVTYRYYQRILYSWHKTQNHVDYLCPGWRWELRFL
jgi:hypothetical protein